VFFYREMAAWGTMSDLGIWAAVLLITEHPRCSEDILDMTYWLHRYCERWSHVIRGIMNCVWKGTGDKGLGERNRPYPPLRMSTHLRDGFPSLVTSFVRLSGDLLWGWELCSVKICLLRLHISVVYFPLLDVKHTHMHKGECCLSMKDIICSWWFLWSVYLCDNGLTDLMEQIFSWEPNSRFPRKVSPSVCWTWRFITVFTRARNLSLSCVGWIHSTSSYPKICFNSIIRGTSKTPKWFLSFTFSYEFPCVFLIRISLMCAAVTHASPTLNCSHQ
jgi:hypothetical protein